MRFLIITALLLGGATSASAQATRVAMRYTGLPATAKYISSDTTSRSMGAGQDVASTIDLTTSVELTMRAQGDSTHVTSRLTDMKGAVSAMGQTMDVSKQPGWDAAVELIVGPDGGARLASLIAAGAEGYDVAAYTRMFPRLPKAAVARGESWTDSTSQTVQRDGISGSMRVRTTGTWLSDSTVGGRSVRVLRYVAQHDTRATGSGNGSDMSQELAGTVTTIALFDPAARLMVEVHETGELRGRLRMGTMDTDMVQRIGRHVRLQ